MQNLNSKVSIFVISWQEIIKNTHCKSKLEWKIKVKTYRLILSFYQQALQLRHIKLQTEVWISSPNSL